MQTSESRRASATPIPVDFTTMLEALKKHLQPASLVPTEEEDISLIQTHASVVLLTNTHAYKLKKPKNFGFFDYSTPVLRRHFCQQEVSLNRALAPHIYLGIAPVLLGDSEQFHFGPIFSPEQVPVPGVVLDGGLVVDYAVVMVRLPDAATLESKVQTASPELLGELACVVAAFHQQYQQDEQHAQWGSKEVITQNWTENFTQIQPYVGRTLDRATYDHIVLYVQGIFKERAQLFDYRVRAGCIRDCHGDLRLQHVYVLDEQTTSDQDRFALLDRIEFNERFRYGDVASEIAFLVMELDAAGRSDLSRAFVEGYIKETGDTVLREVLPFYACYRAFVRGKVLSFQLDEPEVPVNQREQVANQARELFALAAHYATAPTRATLLMIGGLMGNGKSTLALALQKELGWQLFSSDLLRKQSAHVDPGQPQADPFDEGIYSQQWTEHTYQALHEGARTALANGCSIILDASFGKRAERVTLLQEALQAGATAVFVECRSPREIAIGRLAHRWRARLEANQQDMAQASIASDGRPELYQAQADRWEVYIQEMEAPTHHLLIETMQPTALSVECVLDTLKIPRFACWLTDKMFAGKERQKLAPG